MFSSIATKISTKTILCISALIHILCAYFSTGFYHFDEHFQILEFLNFKQGGISAEELTWEYERMVRPWLQVYIYYFTIIPFKFLGIDSPFSQALIIRQFTGLIGFISVLKFQGLLKYYFDNKVFRKWAIILLHFTWFIPYLHIRPSAEGLGLSFFCLGLTYFLKSYYKNKYYYSIAGGFFLGLSYGVRYQLAVAVAVLWFWAIYNYPKKVKQHTFSALSILAIIILGVLVDYFGYGVWTFAPYNLYLANFVDGILSAHGESPIYAYILLSLKGGIFPLALVFLISSAWAFYKRLNNPFVCSMLAFFLFHTIIGHKELRFIFPMLFFTPLYLLFFIEDNLGKLKKYKAVSIFGLFLIIINFVALTTVSFKAANSYVDFHKYIYESEINHFYSKDYDPFSNTKLTYNFYKKQNLTIDVIENKELASLQAPYHLLLHRGAGYLELTSRENCRLLYSNYPTWLIRYFNVGNWASRSKVISFFKCRANH